MLLSREPSPWKSLITVHHFQIILCLVREEICMLGYRGSVLFKQKMLASLVAQTVKNLPAIQKTQVGSLGQQDPLEKEMATEASILAWKIPWTEKPVGWATVHGVAKSLT